MMILFQHITPSFGGLPRFTVSDVQDTANKIQSSPQELEQYIIKNEDDTYTVKQEAYKAYQELSEKDFSTLKPEQQTTLKQLQSILYLDMADGNKDNKILSTSLAKGSSGDGVAGREELTESAETVLSGLPAYTRVVDLNSDNTAVQNLKDNEIFIDGKPDGTISTANLHELRRGNLGKLAHPELIPEDSGVSRQVGEAFQVAPVTVTAFEEKKAKYQQAALVMKEFAEFGNKRKSSPLYHQTANVLQLTAHVAHSQEKSKLSMQFHASDGLSRGQNKSLVERAVDPVIENSWSMQDDGSLKRALDTLITKYNQENPKSMIKTPEEFLEYYNTLYEASQNIVREDKATHGLVSPYLESMPLEVLDKLAKGKFDISQDGSVQMQ